jgi:zinc/manganese transport system permease protein
MLTCLVLVGIYVYFGMHVISRGIIFVDLSLAQVAALGATLALLIGLELGSTLAYLLSLAAALIGAAVFTFTRDLEHQVPQEAIIGIVYAVSAASGVLLVSHQAEGTEHIRHLLVGSILTVTPGEFLKIMLVSALVGIFHIAWRHKFLAATFEPRRKRLHARW